MTAESAVLVVTTDEDDAAWLADQVAAFIEGLYGTMDAAVQIQENWEHGRCVGRLHPGLTSGEYIATKMPTLRSLKGAERDAFIVRLIEAGSSRRQAAKTVGASEITARRAKGATFVAPSEPSPTEQIVKSVAGILGKRSALPGDFDRWLRGHPLGTEREAVAAAFEALAERATGWAASARS